MNANKRKTEPYLKNAKCAEIFSNRERERERASASLEKNERKQKGKASTKLAANKKMEMLLLAQGSNCRVELK